MNATPRWIELKIFVAMFAMLVMPILASASRAAARDVAIVEGPILTGKRGFPYSASVIDVKTYGYTELDYFVSGEAHPLLPAPGAVMGADGQWPTVAGKESPYKTRILVRKPPKERFNGTVIIEFMQEYYGVERDTNFRWNTEAILREGFGWVGASLHREAVNDPTPQQTITYNGNSVTTGITLARWDPERYGSLSIPSSDLSFDILTQIARAVGPKRSKGGSDPFHGLEVRKVIAVGNTISAERLGIYINTVQRDARAIDGFYLQDFVGGAKLKLSEGVPTPPGVLRTNVEVPVIVMLTETAAVQREVLAESPNLRVWTPAGSSHTTGESMARVEAANRRDLGQVGGFCAPGYANSMPVQYVSSAAIVALHRWINGGPPAPSFPQLQKRPDGTPLPVDEHGNTVGGLRTPWFDVPIARYDWQGECTGGSGRTYPFSPAQLTGLYGTPKQFLEKFTAATREAQKKGVLLAEDADEAIRQATHLKW